MCISAVAIALASPVVAHAGDCTDGAGGYVEAVVGGGAVWENGTNFDGSLYTVSGGAAWLRGSVGLD